MNIEVIPGTSSDTKNLEPIIVQNNILSTPFLAESDMLEYIDLVPSFRVLQVYFPEDDKITEKTITVLYNLDVTVYLTSERYRYTVDMYVIHDYHENLPGGPCKAC